MIKYSYNTLVYAGEDIETSIARLVKFGYNGVEFVGEPEQMDVDRIKELLAKYNIEASTICAIYNAERDLVSSNENIRKKCSQLFKKLRRFCQQNRSKRNLADSNCLYENLWRGRSRN
ncbi:hypothetical protein GCM10020331_008730 [Ectobacillus funiculus]